MLVSATSISPLMRPIIQIPVAMGKTLGQKFESGEHILTAEIFRDKITNSVNSSEGKEQFQVPIPGHPNKHMMTFASLLKGYLLTLSILHQYPSGKFFNLPNPLPPFDNPFWSMKGKLGLASEGNKENIRESLDEFYTDKVTDEKINDPNVSLIDQIRLFTLDICDKQNDYCFDYIRNSYNLPFPFGSSKKKDGVTPSAFHRHVQQDSDLPKDQITSAMALVRAFICQVRSYESSGSTSDSSAVNASLGLPTPPALPTDRFTPDLLIEKFPGLDGGCKSNKRINIAEPVFATFSPMAVQSRADGALQAISGTVVLSELLQKHPKEKILWISLDQFYDIQKPTAFEAFAKDKEKLINFWADQFRFFQSKKPFPVADRESIQKLKGKRGSDENLEAFYKKRIFKKQVSDKPQPNSLGYQLNAIQMAWTEHLFAFLMEPAKQKYTVLKENMGLRTMMNLDLQKHPTLYYDSSEGVLRDLFTTMKFIQNNPAEAGKSFFQITPPLNSVLHEKYSNKTQPVVPGPTQFQLDVAIAIAKDGKESPKSFPFPMGGDDIFIGHNLESISGEEVQNAIRATSVHITHKMIEKCDGYKENSKYSTLMSKVDRCAKKEDAEKGSYKYNECIRESFEGSDPSKPEETYCLGLLAMSSGYEKEIQTFNAGAESSDGSDYLSFALKIILFPIYLSYIGIAALAGAFSKDETEKNKLKIEERRAIEQSQFESGDVPGAKPDPEQFRDESGATTTDSEGDRQQFRFGSE